MEKIGINLVSGVAGDADYGLHIYHVGNGFVGITGKVVSRTLDSMYLGFSSERAYQITVEGDLVLSTETNDSYVDKTDGIYGFDIEWSDAAKNFGNGSGKIIMTNPDSPNDVSVFEVFMGDTPSAVVEFKPNTGNNGTVIVREDLDLSAVGAVMKKVLSAPSGSDPYAIGLDFVGALLPVLGFNYGRLFDVNVIRTEDNMSNSMDHESEGRVDVLIVDGPTTPLAALGALLAGDVPVLVVGDYNEHTGDEAFPGGSIFERVGIEELLASYGDDGDVQVEADLRDFGQLARTRQHEIDGIARAVAAADALGIDTSDIASKRDELLAKLAVFSDRFEVGGTHEVTTDEAAVINSVFGELFGIHQELDTCVSHWHHYKQQVEVSQNHWAEGLASRKRNFRLADDSQDNRIATSYVDYAAKPEETLETSKAALVELFQAIQRRDLRAAHEAANKARQFGTREHLLASLIRRGVLVSVEETATAA